MLERAYLETGRASRGRGDRAPKVKGARSRPLLHYCFTGKAAGYSGTS